MRGRNIVDGQARAPLGIKSGKVNRGERVSHPVRLVELHPGLILVPGGDIRPAKLHHHAIVAGVGLDCRFTGVNGRDEIDLFGLGRRANPAGRLLSSGLAAARSQATLAPEVRSCPQARSDQIRSGMLPSNRLTAWRAPHSALADKRESRPLIPWTDARRFLRGGFRQNFAMAGAELMHLILLFYQMLISLPRECWVVPRQADGAVTETPTPSDHIAC